MIAYNLDIVTLSTLTAAGTAVDGLVSANGRARMSDTAPWDMVVAYDAACISSLTVGKVIRLKLASTIVWAGVIEEIVKHPISPNDEVDQNPTFKGRELGCVLDRMACRPRLGFDRSPWSPTRVETFASPEFDISPGIAATALGTVNSPSLYWTGLPTGFPALDVEGIGPATGTTGAAPEGYWYTALDWTLDADSAIAQFSTADNAADVFADGYQIGQINAGTDTTQGLRSTLTSVFFASAGGHRTAAKVVNVPFGGGDPGPGMGPTLGGNPTRYATVGFKVGSDGRLGARVFQTSTSWHNFEYPTLPPGLTIGHIIGIDRTQNQTDGILTGLTLGFTDTVDSASANWDQLESLSRSVGDSLLNELVTWGQTYLDWRMLYTALQLNGYKLGTMGVDSGVSYTLNADPALSGVNDLVRDKIDVGTDCLVVTFKGGQFRYPASGGNRIGFLQLDAASAGEAKTVAAQVLTVTQPEQVTTKIAPTGTGDVPGKDWVVGDVIHLSDGEGGTISERVTEWGWAITDDDVDFDVTVKDRLLTGFEQVGRVVQSFASGSAGGRQPSSPAGPPPTFATLIRSGEITFQPLPTEAPTAGQSPDKIPHESGNIYALAVTATTAGSTDTDFQFIVDGSDELVGTGILPAGATFALIPIASNAILWVEGNVSRMSINLTTVGTGVKGILFEPRAI